MTEASCPNCAAPLAPGQRYCLSCGRTLSSALGGIRGALPAPAEHPPATRRPLRGRRGSRLAGAFTGMLAAGLGAGVLAGALIAPQTPVSAAQLIAVRVPAAGAPAPGAASAATTAAASAVAVQPPAPAAPAPPPPSPTTTVAATTPAPSSADNSSSGGPSSSDTTSSSTTTSASSTTTTSSSTPPTPTPVKLPAIKHVWVIVLTDQSVNALFGPTSTAVYLNKTLLHQGTLLSDYYATAHGALADGIALLSGQGPTPQLQADCPTYDAVTPGTVDPNTGLSKGNGCVFSGKVTSLPDQLTANQLTWRAYIAGQGTPGDPATTCRHPVLGAADPTAATSTPLDGYVTRRNPFVYFDTLTAQPACSNDDVGLSQLGVDLFTGRIPNFSWIAPDLCAAGADGACPAGDTITGAAAADQFLSTYVPQIEATRTYQKDGMIMILSDQAPASGPNADSSACCGRLDYANTSNPGAGAQPGAGGGRTGALVISPFAARGATDSTPSDHYTLLSTLDTLFNVEPLGYAAKRQPFGQTVFPSESGGSDSSST